VGASAFKRKQRGEIGGEPLPDRRVHRRRRKRAKRPANGPRVAIYRKTRGEFPQRGAGRDQEDKKNSELVLQKPGNVSSAFKTKKYLSPGTSIRESVGNQKKGSVGNKLVRADNGGHKEQVKRGWDERSKKFAAPGTHAKGKPPKVRNGAENLKKACNRKEGKKRGRQRFGEREAGFLLSC